MTKFEKASSQALDNYSLKQAKKILLKYLKGKIEIDTSPNILPKKLSVSERITIIEEFNKKAKIDKKWKVSKTRKTFICIITFIVALIYNILLLSKLNIFIASAIPIIGYLFFASCLHIVRKICECAINK